MDADPISNTYPLRVLVVDDNEASAVTLAWAVEAMGDEVLTCFKGKHALEEAMTFKPDVVLLDIGLPDMNGLLVCDQLRSHPPSPDIKLIAQTGWGDEETKRQTLLHGFDMHLVKPVDLVLLEDVLGRLRKYRREN